MTQRLLHHHPDGPVAAPPLLLGPSLGTTLAVWESQVPALAREHRVIRWDLPGHGGSSAGLLPGTEPGRTTVADLAALVIDLADSLGLERFSYAGISLGGAIGAWLAVHHPERIDSLALVCSAARFGTPQTWQDRAALVREQGTSPVAAGAAARWFTPDFAGRLEALALADDLRAADPAAYAACCDALAALDLTGELPRIAARTLVVAGREDAAVPTDRARELADGIPGASVVEIAHAGHLAAVERPEAVRTALLGHFTVRTATDLRRAAGQSVRRAVLGDAHVDRTQARTTAFTADFQDFITRYAWGEIWTRPGLPAKTRSCITLTALVAGGHFEELAMHVRAALRLGLGPEEIKEVLLQTAVYCGVPAANTAFAVAQRVLDEEV